MKKRTQAEYAGGDEGDTINLTPMLDVVFILLIFFVITAAFIRETGVDVRRPPGKHLIETPVDGALMIELDTADQIKIAGLIIDPRAVRAHIERAHATDLELEIVVAVSPDSTTATLVSVIDAARQAGLPDVVITDAPGEIAILDAR